MKNYTKTPNFLVLRILLITFVVSFISCSYEDTTKQTDGVISITENGQQVFYSEINKAYGDVYLGMSKHAVDSLETQPTIYGRKYNTFKDYTKGILTSYYLRSPEVADSLYNDVIDELEEVLSSKYGKINMVWLSDLPELGISEKTTIEKHEVFWGSHWKKDSKYLGIGFEQATDTTSSIWLWIFDTKIWDAHKSNKTIIEAENF